MDQMNDQEFDACLRYMQTHNCEDFEAAYKAIK